MVEEKKPEKKVPTFDEAWKYYYDYIVKVIDEKGIYPLPGMFLSDKGLAIAAICGSELVFPFAIRAISEMNAQFVIFGLDRVTKPGQGTEFADAFTMFGWNGKEWIMGVVNYQNEPRIVREIDRNNKFWNEIMARELRAAGLPQLTESRIRVE